VKKKSLFSIISLIITGTFLLIPQSVYSIHLKRDRTKQAQPEFFPARLIVKLKPEVDKGIILGKVQGKVITGLAELDSLNFKFKVKKQEKLFKEFKTTALKSDKLSSTYILEVPAETDLKRMKVEYEKRPEVEYVELDYKLELFETPNDPLFPHQWFLNNIGTEQNHGQGYYGIDREVGHTLVMKFGVEDADIDAKEAFQRDDEITIPLVGIIDTGVDVDHEDLKDNIWTNPGEIPDNGIDDDHNGFVDDFHGWDFSGDSAVIQEDNDPTDTYGHGTHCAGIVAAVRNNGIGVSGINTPCKIMAIKFFPNASMSLGARSIIYAADMGCDVINMSWGTPYPSKLIEDALDYAIYRGVLPIAAAGNDSTEQYNYPAACKNVLTVGASNSHDEVIYFSTYGDHIEVVAPGRDILSLRADDTDMYAEDGFPNSHIVDEKYYLADGTSMASPCAVGVAAYILTASPGVSNQRIIEIIEQSADDIIYPYGGDSLYSPGKDIYSGYGRVNLNSALQLLSGRLAKIDYPFENTLVTETVAILGTASGDSFENYVLEYGEGYSPEDWTEIASYDVPVKKDTLGIWNSSGLTGLFTLRLTVGDQNQAIVHVIANNDSYVKITYPDQDDTITGYAEIYGYTIVPDLSHYTLEYGYGESPSYWFPITSSTKMVADYILGNWLVSFLNEMNYSIRLSVETNAGEIYADTVGVVVKSIASAGWVQKLAANGSLSPTVGDVDGDGYNEIVVGVGGSAESGITGGVEIFNHKGEREPGWPKDTDKNMMSSPALGDLDGDGIDDIVICSEQGVHAYLSGSEDWFRNAGTGGNEFWSLATPVIADLENDGYCEILITNDLGIVYAWRNDGQAVIPGKDGVFAQTDLGGGSFGHPSLSVADLDKDGENEVIVGNSRYYSGLHGGVYIFDIRGHQLLGPGDYPDKFDHISGIAIANIDENDDLEIIVFGANEDYFTLWAFKKDGAQAAGYPIILENLKTGWWFANHPAIGDLEGNGTLEIVVSIWTIGEARIYAWHQDGTPACPAGFLVSMKSPNAERNREVLSTLGNNIGEIVAKIKTLSREKLTSLGISLEDTVFASVAETFGSPILADVNGDGNVDIIARAGYFLGTGFERVFAWNYEGNLISGFPLYASAGANLATFYPYTPVVADMDKDGKLNMVLVTDYNIYAKPKLISWEFDTDYDTNTVPWPKYMHDKCNSGRFGFSPPGAEITNAPPSNLHVKSWDDSSVILAWTPKSPLNSFGYNIYRTTVSGHSGEKITPDLIPQPDSQYQDAGLILGQTYYYTITNVDTNFEESDRSPEVRITVGRPSAPTELQAQVAEGVVMLTWRSNPTEENVLSYIIYHKSPNFTEYQLMDSVTAETSYVDSSLKWAGTHYYQVSAVNSIGLESLPSEAVEVNFQPIGFPPQYLKVSTWYGRDVTLSWKVSKEGQGCNIYRSTVSGIYNDPPLNSTLIDDPTGVEIFYQDTGLTETVTYYYVITQIRELKESSPSNEVGFLAGRPQALTSLTGEVRDCRIEINWNPSAEGDVVRYRIYDKILPENDYVLIDSVEHDTIYIDPATNDSFEHYYLVTAVDSLGLESFFPTFPPTTPAHVYGPFYPLDPPSEFRIISYTDTSITFKTFAPDVYAYNIYRSTISGEYNEPPINSSPIPHTSPYQYIYYPTDLIESENYFFNATCIKQGECGTAESKMDTLKEVSFIPGVPQVTTGLSADLDSNCNVVVSWKPNPEGDIVKYKIYHKRVHSDSLFQVKDSVFAPKTTYVDTSISDTLEHCYAVSAEDSLGLEGHLFYEACVWLGKPMSPRFIQIVDWTDTSATMSWYTDAGTDIIGCNVYRSLVIGDYTGLRPINDTLIALDSIGHATYTDFDVTEGITYYYTATNVNKCRVESELYPGNWLEDNILVGKPHSPLLEVRSGKENIKLYIFPSDTDIKGYRIYRQEDAGTFQVMDQLYLDTVYTDSSAIAGVDYHYKVKAIDILNLKGLPSEEVEGCLMLFDQGIILVDMTCGVEGYDGVKGDSVDAFYQRALESYDYTYVDLSDRAGVSLFELSSHPVAIVHCEDEPSAHCADNSYLYSVLKQYLQAGGALLIEGRRNLLERENGWGNEFWHFAPGDFRRDYLNMDSAYIPKDWSPGDRSEEFIGAFRTPQMHGYPETVELDTFRVNHAYDPKWFNLEGKLTGIGYFMPRQSSEVIYTFVSAYDTSGSNGKSVALKHFTDDFAVIYFDFPLYFVKEDIATQILHQALHDLEQFAKRSASAVGAAGGLAHASVFPNPFKPYQGHTHMTFDGLTAQARIEIFTITGERVCTIEETNGDGKASWDVTNSQGNKLASGIYIYRIANDRGQEKISKFAVIR